ncbi:hypothetical protein F5B19DRAFT_499303 [Rostrohypoxylon terebratum]|nr:hypothetical protein F5B19DRAFT_499303 [Rostrohypoxylon terebratum]
MSSNGNQTIFGQVGVWIPYETTGAGDNAADTSEMAKEGFILCQIFKKRVYVVQSVSNDRLYFVKRLENKKAASRPLSSWDYSHPYPNEFRFTNLDHAHVQVRHPRIPQLPAMEYWRSGHDPDNGRPYYELYFEYLNGGNLQNLRDAFYHHEKRVPGAFVWHVAHQLCKVLLYLRYGVVYPDLTPAQLDGTEPRPEPANAPNWVEIYHRDITMENIMLDYAPARGGEVNSWDNPENAFPRVVLCDYGDMAMRNDAPALLRPSKKFPNDKELNQWEDIYQVGCVLRSLCMTHVKFPEDERPVPRAPIEGQQKDESQRWAHRPESRRLIAINGRNPGPQYSDDLIQLLEEFEWDDQEDRAVELDVNRVVPKAEGFYDNIDVSWTRPYGPMPYVSRDVPWNRPEQPMQYGRDNHRWTRSRRRIRRWIRTTEFRQVGMEMLVTKRTRPLVGPPIDGPLGDEGGCGDSEQSVSI